MDSQVLHTAQLAVSVTEKAVLQNFNVSIEDTILPPDGSIHNSDQVHQIGLSQLGIYSFGHGRQYGHAHDIGRFQPF